MDADETAATDGGAVASLDQEALYATIYSATKDAMQATIATTIYLLLAAFFVFGGMNLALSNPGVSSTIWGLGVSMTGVVIAAEATGVTSLFGRFR